MEEAVSVRQTGGQSAKIQVYGSPEVSPWMVMDWPLCLPHIQDATGFPHL